MQELEEEFREETEDNKLIPHELRVAKAKQDNVFLFCRAFRAIFVFSFLTYLYH